MKKIFSSIPWIVDTTLRDGLQTPGIYLDAHAKMKILAFLEEIGVQESEIGIPAMGAEERSEQIKLLKNKHLLRKTGWCRARKEDVFWGLECGYESLHISVPVSKILLGSMKKEEHWLYDQMEECITICKPHLKFLSVGLQDASRTSREILVKAIHLCRKKGIDRVRLADTVGIWTPAEVFEVISDLKKEAGEMILGFHGHNDLGLASANTYTAWLAGVTDLDVTFNGLGERAGNAPLEEVLLILKIKSALSRFPFRIEKMGQICKQVSEMTGISIPAHKPVTGSDVFTHESGIHVEALIKDKKTFEPFDPLTVGHEGSRVVYGKNSGRHGVEEIFREAGMEKSPEKISETLSGIKKISRTLRRAIEKSELIQWVKGSEKAL